MLHALLHFTLHESSFSRSYGGILPSSLTRVFPRTLGFSPRLPVSVLVRVVCLYLEAFLDSVGSTTSLKRELVITPQLLGNRICLVSNLHA